MGRPAPISGQFFDGRLRQRLGLDHGALVHGIRAQPAVEVLGQHPLVRQLPGGKRLLQATLGVVGQIELGDGAPRIGERRLHRVDAEDEGLVMALRAPASLLRRRGAAR